MLYTNLQVMETNQRIKHCIYVCTGSIVLWMYMYYGLTPEVYYQEYAILQSGGGHDNDRVTSANCSKAG